MKAVYVLVRYSGMMNEIVLSKHKTRESAEVAQCKYADKTGYNAIVINVGPSGTSELIEVFGKLATRPRAGFGGTP